jgi:glycosyltransferase involved in cell wall biosynthesis
MDENRIKPNILYVDPNAADKGHLLSDDLFLAECLKPLANELLVVTSVKSVENLRQKLSVKVRENKCDLANARYPRLCLLRNSLSLPGSRFSDIVFQSFEEVSTLLFMILHPHKRIHLIVTNNLRPDRLKRHPILGRFFLKKVFHRAASIIVHCQHEIETIKKICSGIETDKLFIKPFHQTGYSRNRMTFKEKKRMILFIGPDQPHKRIDNVIQLIKSDVGGKYSYCLCKIQKPLAPHVQNILEEQSNVKVLHGYLDNDEYYRLISEATFIILTHDRDFEGALSGIFCDAIASGTPVIARNMAPHNEFFDHFGDMGYLVDFSVPHWFNDVLNYDVEKRYEEFQNNMAACRAFCSRESIREVFQKILNLI